LIYYLVPESNTPEIQLFPNEKYLIGRSPQSNILLTDKAISREHAKLEYSNSTFILEDLGSTNGTKVNDSEISIITLESMDKLTFGRISFTFKIKKLSKNVRTTLTSDDTRVLEEDLEMIIDGLNKSTLKNQLTAFQNKMNKKRKDLITLAYGDELTGLYNRRYFDKELETEIKRAVRYNRPLTMIMVDIDKFKVFNDTYGHQKGDSVLRTVGTILKENSRSSDIVCRYGGEEIAILLPEQNTEQGLIAADKLRLILTREAKEIEGVEITASFGVATTGKEINSGELLIKKSDDALYKAKKSGRNCVKN